MNRPGVGCTHFETTDEYFSFNAMKYKSPALQPQQILVNATGWKTTQ